MSTYNQEVRERVERYAVTEEVELQDVIGTLLGRNVTPELTGNLAAKGIRELVDMSVQELVMYGISKQKAIGLHASFLLAKKLLVANTKEQKFSIRSPHDAAAYLVKELAGSTQEHFGALFLNTKREVVRKKTIFIGTLDKCTVHAREVFHEAIKSSAAFIILFHTHPSGHRVKKTSKSRND